MKYNFNNKVHFDIWIDGTYLKIKVHSYDARAKNSHFVSIRNQFNVYCSEDTKITEFSIYLGSTNLNETYDFCYYSGAYNDALKHRDKILEALHEWAYDLPVWSRESSSVTSNAMDYMAFSKLQNTVEELKKDNEILKDKVLELLNALNQSSQSIEAWNSSDTYDKKDIYGDK